jgi:hypothetical protein
MFFARLFSQIAVCIFALVVLFSAASTAHAQPITASDIFDLQSQINALPLAPGTGLTQNVEVPNRTAERRLASRPGVGRIRTAAIAPNYVEALKQGASLQRTKEGKLASNGAQLYVLNLFDDVSVRAAKIDFKTDSLNNDVWRGVVVGPEQGEATLVIVNGAITGKVRVGSKTYGIQPAGDGLHTIIAYDEKTIPVIDDDTLDKAAPPAAIDAQPELQAPPHPSLRELPDQNKTAEELEKPTADATLRVLMVYTARAAAARPNIQADISLSISNMNTTLANSGAGVAIELAGVEQVNIDETPYTLNTLLMAATDGFSDFARIAQVRARLGADIVQVWGVTRDQCGLAWVNDYLDTVTASTIGYYVRRGIGAVAIEETGSCISSAYDAPTHELGHNIGALHDRYTQNLNGSKNIKGPAGYNYGYIDLAAGFSDVMAYSSLSGGRNQCDARGVECPNIPYFSNPNVTYNGRPVGIADSLPDAANNTRRIREMMPYLAAYDTYLAAPKLTITINGAAGSGTVTSDSGLNCTATCDGTTTGGQVVTLTATPAAGRTFQGWDGSGECVTSTSTSTGGTCTIVMNGWTNMIAQFGTSATARTLNVTRTGTGTGIVSSAPAGIACGSTCTTVFPNGTAVALTATPDPGSRFAGWATDCSGLLECNLNMTATRNVSATFTLIPAGTQALNVSVTGSGSVTSAPMGINCSTSCSADFNQGTYITLTATPGNGATFTGWEGPCSGTGKCTVTMNAALSVKAAFTTSTSTTQTVSLNIKGSGRIYNSGSLSCTASCTTTFSVGSRVTLASTPASGWIFAGWNGLCGGTGSCTFTVVPGLTINATFIQVGTGTVSLGAVYTSTQATTQSFLRIHNTDTKVGGVETAILAGNTGALVAEWTTPDIAPGASRQFAITDIERTVGIGSNRPDFYTFILRPKIKAYAQHVLYRPSDGTLTNLSTCSAGVTTNTTQLINVHSSILNEGFPSTVVVMNTGAVTTNATLGVYDASTGARLGTGTLPVSNLPAGGQTQIPISAIESSLGISPTAAAIYHYIIKVETGSNVLLQHLVNNRRVGVLTDMTTTCSLEPITNAGSAVVRLPLAYSTTQTATQSFIRVHNTGSESGTVALALNADTTGETLATWTSPSIAPGASRQFSLDEIERGANKGFTKPSTYALRVNSSLTGYMQHVLYRPADGTLTNLSTCDTGVGINSKQLTNVHSTLLGNNFPSTIVVNNASASTDYVYLSVYDSTTGTRLGGTGLYYVGIVPPYGQTHVRVADIESNLKINPVTSSIYHYNIKVDIGSSYLQHLVNNAQVGVITDMTTKCALKEDDAAPDSILTTATIQPNTTVNGRINFEDDQDWYKVTLNRGGSYRINLTGNTLYDPKLSLRDATGKEIAFANSSTSAEILDFIEPGGASQTYYIVASGAQPYWTGAYTLSVRANTDDISPDSIATNGTIALGSTVSGAINYTGDTDWYKITLNRGGTYLFNLSSLTLYNPKMSIRDASGNEVAVANDFSGSTAESINFVEPGGASQTYFIVVSNASSFGDGTYRLSVTQGLADDVSPDSTATNGAINVGENVSRSINFIGDRDWFRISLTANQLYVFELRRGTLIDPYLRIMNSAGTQVSSDDDGGAGLDSYLAFIPATTGSYYLVASSSTIFNTTGTYTLYTRMSGAADQSSVTPTEMTPLPFSEVTLIDSRAVNTSTTQTSGMLRAELWYFTQPYAPDVLGYKVAQKSLNALPPGQEIAVDYALAPSWLPPRGIYYPTVILTEYRPNNCTATDFFCTAASVNLPAPITY